MAQDGFFHPKYLRTSDFHGHNSYNNSIIATMYLSRNKSQDQPTFYRLVIEVTWGRYTAAQSDPSPYHLVASFWSVQKVFGPISDLFRVRGDL